jgi:hypothetical protein
VTTASIRLIQRVRTSSSTVITAATNTGLYAYSTAIPTITTGNPIAGLQVLNFTPQSTLNILEVDVVVNFTTTILQAVMVALFSNANVTPANAVIVGAYTPPAANNASQIFVKYRVTAGTISPITFNVRIGGTSASSVIVNGDTSSNALFGGTWFSSCIVSEYSP